MILDFNLNSIVISDLYETDVYPSCHIPIIRGLWYHEFNVDSNIFYMHHIDYLPTPVYQQPTSTIFTSTSRLRIASNPERKGVILMCQEGVGFYDIYLSMIPSPYVDGPKYIMSGVTIDLNKRDISYDSDYLKGLL